jgi:hypothetical protein
VDQQRYQRNRVRVVAHEAYRTGELRGTELQRLPNAGQRVGKIDRDPAGHQAFLEFRKCIDELREARITYSVLCAASENSFKGFLCLYGDPGAERQLWWHDTIEDDCAYRARVTAHKMLCYP